MLLAFVKAASKRDVSCGPVVVGNVMPCQTITGGMTASQEVFVPYEGQAGQGRQ